MSFLKFSDEVLAELPDDILDVLPIPSRMSEDDFVAWNREKVRAEWVDGEVILLFPKDISHLRVSMWLMHILDIYAEEYEFGTVLSSGFTVRLSLPVRTSRRLPDLMFVAKDRSHLILKNHLEGPPDLAVEIVSPDSKKRDWHEKLEEYEAAGVREYWIIDPDVQRFEAFQLNPQGQFDSIYNQPAGLFASQIVPGFQIQIEWLWADNPPFVLSILKGLGINA